MNTYLEILIMFDGHVTSHFYNAASFSFEDKLLMFSESER